MFNPQGPEVQFGINTVRQAALLVKQIQRERVSATLTKKDLSPVTVADFASQALVAKLLTEAFPDDPLVAEEDSAALKRPDHADSLAMVTDHVSQLIPEATSSRVCDWIDRGGAAPADRYWTLDPIDGTKGFLRNDQFAVALALVISGEVHVGVLGCPNLKGASAFDAEGSGSLVVAVRGQGAWVAGLTEGSPFERLMVSAQVDPRQARVLRSFESGHTNAGQIDALVQTLKSRAEPVRMDSQAKYAVLAAGGGELYLRLLSPSRPDYRERIWDQAAGSLIVQEAGGQVTDLYGAALDFSAGRTLVNNRGILASNGRLHQAALEALRAIGA